jgi:polar amino acid transport system substrate-binding protein
VVRFLTEGDFPPFNYLDEDGVLSGFNVDLARALCNEIGAACDIRVRPWDELLVALQRGEADAVIAGHTVTPDSLRRVAFTDRYFQTPGRFAAKTDAEKIEIAPDQLDGRSIAVARGTPHEAFLKTFFRDSRIQPFETAELARDALLQGKVDYVFDDGIGLAFWINGTLSRRCCELRGGPYFEPRFFGDGLAIAVPRNDLQIKALLNAALHKVRASGRFDELVSRYFPHRVF